MSETSAMRLMVALALLAWVAPAAAQVESREGIALQNQILELRRQVQTLQDQSNRGGGSPTNLGRGAYSASTRGGSDLVAQLLSQGGCARGTGAPAPGPHRRDAERRAAAGCRSGQAHRRHGVPGAESSRRRRHEDRSRAAGRRRQPNLPLTPPPSSLGQPPLHRQPTGATGQAHARTGAPGGQRRVGAARLSGAEQAAREVLTSSRTSPRAYDAQFLLAQALIGQRQFSQAAIAYDDTYNRARKGTHAQDALLGLANSLIAINEKKAACDTLAETACRISQPQARYPRRHGRHRASAQAAVVTLS